MSLHRTADVKMASESFRNVVRNKIIASIGARMDPPPDGAAGWSVRKQPLMRALRRVTLPGEQEARLIYVGAKMASTLVWNGPPEEVGAAKEALFMPQMVTMPESVHMQAVEVTPAKEGVKAVMRYTAVAAGEVEVHIFWGMAGSPVVLPPMEVATPAARPEREKWEANPRRMIAVGGMSAAKAYSDKAVSSRKDRPSGAQAAKAKGKGAQMVPMNAELASKIAELLKTSIQSVLDGALPGQDVEVCEKTAGRLGKVLSRLNPPMELTAEAVKGYMPVPHATEPESAPMRIPVETAKAACYPPKGGGRLLQARGGGAQGEADGVLSASSTSRRRSIRIRAPPAEAGWPQGPCGYGPKCSYGPKCQGGKAAEANSVRLASGDPGAANSERPVSGDPGAAAGRRARLDAGEDAEARARGGSGRGREVQEDTPGDGGGPREVQEVEGQERAAARYAVRQGLRETGSDRGDRERHRGGVRLRQQAAERRLAHESCDSEPASAHGRGSYRGQGPGGGSVRASGRVHLEDADRRVPHGAEAALLHRGRLGVSAEREAGAEVQADHPQPATWATAGPQPQPTQRQQVRGLGIGGPLGGREAERALETCTVGMGADEGSQWEQTHRQSGTDASSWE